MIIKLFSEYENRNLFYTGGGLFFIFLMAISLIYQCIANYNL